MSDRIKKIIYSMHPLERAVLKHADLKDLVEIGSKSKLNLIEINTGFALLEQKGLAKIEKKDDLYVGLDKFGEKYLKEDLPEIKLLKEVQDGPKKLSQIKLDKSQIGSAIGVLRILKLIEVEKADEQIIKPSKEVKQYLKNFKNPLKEFEKDVLKSKLSEKQKNIYSLFSRRPGFVKEIRKKSISFKLTDEAKLIAKELNLNYKDLKLIETLSSDMLKSGSWKGKEFRHYEINAKTSYDNIGRYHPMLEANNILKDIFVEMGFCEMSGPLVESAFWNMDTMWIPQDHPARDEQDTFYLDGMAKVPSELVKKVKDMHERGIKKGHTAKDEWSELTTKKRLLRTHSTSTSFRTLYE